ncbi:hypothetical protein J3R30DRAFT_3662318 [Lentinula aciculospora]|uniref:Uncharacterized protein n=1 Tax=Lentinula aciculospora TaxID=153920 RepID=A0A9W9DFB7_9AGAR|nr:hypothetical protein J3R30DRAFT_3662318 [Lentinula aciculospora]
MSSPSVQLSPDHLGNLEEEGFIEPDLDPAEEVLENFILESVPPSEPSMNTTQACPSKKQKWADIGGKKPDWLSLPPSIDEAAKALIDIETALQPRWRTGAGFKDLKLNYFTWSHMEGMRALLALYTAVDSHSGGKWVDSSMTAAIAIGHGKYCARTLRVMSRQYMQDRAILPFNPFGDWNETLLVNEDLCQELNLHLQQLYTTDKGITSSQVVEFLSRPDIIQKHGITKQISKSTAIHYLHVMGYHFSWTLTGQYVDGHECDDLWKCTHIFDKDRNDITDQIESLLASGKHVVLWYHDESIFYAHDCRRKAWYHKDAKAKPYRKGEGVSLMVADFVSADYGWLVGPKSGQSACVLLEPGKNCTCCNGYLT